MNAIYQPTWVTEQLAVGAAPMSYAHLDALKEAGIVAILNLCGEFCDLHDIECAAGFEVYHMPLADEEAPQLIELEKALAWLDEAIYLGKKVLIHCRHGIGRTGTVLNAYLLRRGLGHKLAWFKLRKLKSKPANFAQWWTIRKYGKDSPKLTLREPSLEIRRAVDLAPFFRDYEALLSHVDTLIREDGLSCGRDHVRCCYTPIHMTLIESVYITNQINVHLQSDQRLEIISRAVQSAKNERQIARIIDIKESCLSNVSLICSVNVNKKCLIYKYRPIQCRLFDVDENTSCKLWSEFLEPSLERLSCELWMSLTGNIVKNKMQNFSFCDVISGKYIQKLFHLMSVV